MMIGGRGGGRGRGRGRGRGTEREVENLAVAVGNLELNADILELSADDVLKHGLEYVGFGHERQSKVNKKKNKERFRAFYGIGNDAVAALLKDLQTSESARVKNLNLKHFFLALNFLKTYNTEVVLSGWWDFHEDTVNKWSWFYIEKIQQLKEEKIYMGDFEYDTVFLLTVDGVHCRTYEARKNPTSKVYSHKNQGPAVAFELGLAIYEDRLVWINGPFDASVHDKTMFESKHDPDSGLMAQIPQGKRVIADSGYKGLSTHVTTHQQNHSKDMRKFINRVRARHENFNARIKSFKILAERFRSDRKHHKSAFEAVCVLCQYDLENGHPLMEVCPR